MTVSIVAIRAHGAGDEVAVVFEICGADEVQKETLILSAMDFADLRLAKGEVPTACFDAVLEVSKRYAAKKRAMYILSYGGCSETRLAQKLRAKGVEAPLAKSVAAELAEEGYLNEQGDAHREAQKNAAKLWGERRIAADLRAKGYGSEAIREALEALCEEIDFSELCSCRIKRFFGEISDDPAERKKQIASLERAGFSFSQIREAMRRS